MELRGIRRGLLAALVLGVAVLVGGTAAGPAAAVEAGPTASADASPAATARLGAAVDPRYDRTYKCDLLERLPAPPELVIFGGSRAQRFEPSVAERLTGLPAFNFAVQNSRPEDVYAMSRLLFWRAPSVKLRCVWALQATIALGLASASGAARRAPALPVPARLPGRRPAEGLGAHRRP